MSLSTRRFTGILVILGGVLLFTACGRSPGPVEEIQVKANEFAFEPASLDLKKGQRVRIQVQNTGVQTHDFSSDAPASNVNQPRSGGHAGMTTTSKLHVALEPGQTASLTFTPSASGVFPFWCSVTGHREAGMAGQLQVQ